jgi:hypothetical protein
MISINYFILYRYLAVILKNVNEEIAVGEVDYIIKFFINNHFK